MEKGPVIVLGDLNYCPKRPCAETEVDREVRRFVEEMGLQELSYNGAPGTSNYPAPEGSAASRVNAVYSDCQWVCGVRVGYMVGPEEMQNKKGHCPMMVMVEVRVGGPGDNDEDNKCWTKRESACPRP